MESSVPNLAHVVPDVKVCLKDKSMNEFFCCNNKNFIEDPNIVNYKPEVTVTSMKMDGIDAVYIDNVLTAGMYIIVIVYKISYL